MVCCGQYEFPACLAWSLKHWPLATEAALTPLSHIYSYRACANSCPGHISFCHAACTGKQTRIPRSRGAFSFSFLLGVSGHIAPASAARWSLLKPIYHPFPACMWPTGAVCFSIKLSSVETLTLAFHGEGPLFKGGVYTVCIPGQASQCWFSLNSIHGFLCSYCILYEQCSYVPIVLCIRTACVLK